LEPYPHKTLSEVVLLYDKGLLDEKAVQLKINFNELIDRFERENINIIEFASSKTMREKIQIINNKLIDYVKEIKPTTTTTAEP
jgi:uroporphyrinogen-III synthase